MSKWKIYTPEGVQDILTEDCYLKRNLESNIREQFKAWGYNEIESPTIEFFDAFSADSDSAPQETMFKFFDQNGRILVLRPDLTIPVARIAATKYRDVEQHLKFCYIGNCYKYNEMGGGKQKEYTQAGVEILGVSTPEADAEVIAAAITAVRSTGLENFQIDIGQVEFFKGLMEETGVSESDTEQMRRLIDSKDFLGIEELVKVHAIREDLKELILSLPKLFGSIDLLDRVEKITTNRRSLEALANLRQVVEILEDYGFGKYVSVDLGMVQGLHYYTGIIFRGFTYGIGFPIVSGGRYDTLVEKFGKKSPATGFSLGINMVLTALDRQKIPTEKPAVDTLVCYQPEGRKTAFEIGSELRKQGLSVEMDIKGEGSEVAKAYAKAKGIGGVLYIRNTDQIEVHNLNDGSVESTTVKELLNR